MVETATTSLAGLSPAGPDLTIESATVRLAKDCRPSSPLLYISATVHNRGLGAVFAGSWSSVVYARDTYTSGWGNGLVLPVPAEGDYHSVTFPIYFLDSSPESMTGTHEFIIGVASKDINESNYSNNRFGPLVVDVPSSLCRELDGGRNGSTLQTGALQ